LGNFNRFEKSEPVIVRAVLTGVKEPPIHAAYGAPVRTKSAVPYPRQDELKDCILLRNLPGDR